jgi:murein DD-endopeptidase MepM/ murein hydrolase activator NlpD
MDLRSTGRLLFGSSRKARIVSVTALCLAVCAFGAAGVAPMPPDPADLPVKAITQDLLLPDLHSQVAALEQNKQLYVSEERVRSGDTLGSLLNRLGVEDNAAVDFIKSDQLAHNILQLRAGKRVQAWASENGELRKLSATIVNGHDDAVKNIVVERKGQGFTAYETPAALEKRIEMRTAEIRSSLFAATDSAQIPDTIALQLVDMFSTNIDFATDLRRGDRFNVVYETFWQNGEYVRTGRVLASEFVNAGKTYQAVWYDDPQSKQGGSYYSFDGKSLKKAFLKSPLEFTRISSGFAMRMHPILGIWKQHKGVDFAAPIGTPIRAAATGVIDFAGVQRGYGNVVVIKHWSSYSTAYAHMSRFASGVHKGMKVNQGDVIGYVGATGWATGPHLHYEFRVNNEPRDPMSVDVPNAQPLAGLDLLRFHSVAADMTHRIALLRADDAAIKLAAK